jgi:hypothetical protein
VSSTARSTDTKFLTTSSLASLAVSACQSMLTPPGAAPGALAVLRGHPAGLEQRESGPSRHLLKGYLRRCPGEM